MKNAYPYIPLVLLYLGVFAINMPQIVGLYQMVLGGESTGVSPWLGMFVIDISVLFLSIKKTEWGEWSVATIFAGIIGLLDFIFLLKIAQPDYSTLWGFVVIGVSAIFSFLFAYLIHYFSKAIANKVEEQARERQELAKAEQAESKDRASWEQKTRKEIQDSIKAREEVVKESEDLLKKQEEEFDRKAKEFKEVQKALKGPLRYGKFSFKVELTDGKPKLERYE